LEVPSSSFSQLVMSTLMLGGSNCNCDLAITPLATLGSLLVISGALIRYQCFQTLGKLFTFELSLHSDQKLITTGPYAVVRHPSYIAAIMSLTGAVFSKTIDGSLLQECGALYPEVGKILVSCWMIATVFISCGVIFRRIPEEEAVLKKKFGKEWDEWEHRVQYRLIPGIY